MAEANTISSLSYMLPALPSEIFTGIEGAFINERLQMLNEVLRRIHFAYISAADSSRQLREFQKIITNDPNQEDKEKLTLLYRTAVRDTEDEADLTRIALDLIHEIRNLARSRQKKLQYGIKNKIHIRRGQLMKILNDSASTLPLFIGKTPNEKAPPLCGAVPADANYVAKTGDLVAALVKSSPQASTQSNDWILAEVAYFNSSTNKYEVDDIDEEQKDRHLVAKRYIIPLPLMRANPETDPDALFPQNTNVLALYPQTTCFYNGKVQEPPKHSNGLYHILFEDNSYPEGFSPPLEVPQRYVITSKEHIKNMLRKSSKEESSSKAQSGEPKSPNKSQ